MFRFILQRVQHAAIVLVLVVILAFVGTNLMPGDTIAAAVAETGQGDAETIAALKVQFGLDKPLPIQLVNWAGNFVRGNWGVSIGTGQQVFDMFAQRLPPTLELFIGGTIWSLLLGLPTGFAAALRPNSWLDRILSTSAMIGISLPPFCAGILFIYLFAVWLPIFPPSGYVSFYRDPLASVEALFLPTLVLGIINAGFLARYVRSNMLEILRQDYIRTARAKGLSEVGILLFHAIRPAMISLLTVIGLSFSTMVTGAFFVEVIFAIPGLGQMGVQAIFGKDIAVIQALLVLTAINVLVINLVIDLMYAVLDPRVRLE